MLTSLVPLLTVVGALLGTQAGRDVEVMNSFEVVVNDEDGQLKLDHGYFVTRRDQCTLLRFACGDAILDLTA